jgi:hypothetical protein
MLNSPTPEQVEEVMLIISKWNGALGLSKYSLFFNGITNKDWASFLEESLRTSESRIQRDHNRIDESDPSFDLIRQAKSGRRQATSRSGISNAVLTISVAALALGIIGGLIGRKLWSTK